MTAENDALSYSPITAAETLLALDNVSPEQATRRIPLPTGFMPLDEVIGGGLRAGELVVLGGPSGVGKTIFALQLARNVARSESGAHALYICYEHEPDHLLTRLICLESADLLPVEQALTIRRLDEMGRNASGDLGVISALRGTRRYEPVISRVAEYAQRLHLARPGRLSATLSGVERWTRDLVNSVQAPTLVVIDYLQKITTDERIDSEDERMTEVIQGLKDLALNTGTRILAIAAADRVGLKSPRMRLSDLRGSSAVQYEADIGLVVNNKHAIVSREHLLNDPVHAEEMRGWLVLSIEKNRAGMAAVNLEFKLDAAHFRLHTAGKYVRERLVDQHTVMA